MLDMYPWYVHLHGNGYTKDCHDPPWPFLCLAAAALDWLATPESDSFQRQFLLLMMLLVSSRSPNPCSMSQSFAALMVVKYVGQMMQ